MQLRLENFRCFRQATVDFSPLTVVIGPNAAGKSTLLRALGPDVVPQLSDADAWQGRTDRTISISVSHAGGRARVGGRTANNPPRFQQADPIEYQLLRLDAERLRAQNPSLPSKRLHTDGSNLTSVFDSLTRREQETLGQQFCSLVPVFSDVDSRPGPSAGLVQLLFQDRWNPKRWYGAEEVSDGSMFTLAFLLLNKQQPPIDVLAIEHPEHGLHPFLLGEVVSLLRRLAKGELNERRMNVVLTTHSPTLLEFVEPYEVRLLNREEDGSVTVASVPTQDPRWREAFKVYDESLGQAWLSGGLGGTP